MKKLMKNSGGFLTVYILVALLTYILPYFGSNSVMANAAGGLVDVASGGRTSMFTHFPFLLHAICLIILCIASFMRGGWIGKKWIVIFPIIALLFDLTPVLSSIPFIPTILHIIVLVIGATGKPADIK
ncbi:MAG: hypothetical protein EKK57_02550 [Proteobacteria bacterium]|nr:MAG: hypothetical protein EKK57_02550 [Pseudomonadota bacterium]